MNALEFEADIAGDTVRIPTHLLSRVQPHQQVKVVLVFPEEKAGGGDNADLKDEILRIGEYCSALPLLDDRTPNEILGYDDRGLPT